jgi:hypothetical protein
MRFFTAVTAFLAAGFAASSPIATGQDVNVAERAEVTSLSDFSSQVESLKGVVVKDFSSCEIRSTFLWTSTIILTSGPFFS